MNDGYAELKHHLSEFDGRAVSILSEAAMRFQDRPERIDLLIRLVSDPAPHMSSAATWILKSELEAGKSLTDAQTQALIRQLEQIEDWQAMLHLCQFVQYLQPDPDSAQRLGSWLQPLLSHKRPFLRAWALDALCHMGTLYQEFEGAATQALAAAAEDPAASVRARARKRTG